MKRTFILHPLPETYAICRLQAEEKVPNWVLMSRIFFMARTDEELSFICCQDNVPDSVRADRNWSGFRVQGPFPLNEIGVLASILEPLALAGISILASSISDS